ncbi:hypothetical protein HanRHA438_Chr06g0281041 [Helianthus annuus]|nr:hypothetical protein HanRHA438_Chr06g0281041 [Helianthus annuus]
MLIIITFCRHHIRPATGNDGVIPPPPSKARAAGNGGPNPTCSLFLSLESPPWDRYSCREKSREKRVVISRERTGDERNMDR